MRGPLRVLAVPAALAALATGCGIRPTDVVEVGDPATVRIAPAGSAVIVLYFIGPSSPRTVLPVTRRVTTVGGQESGPGPDKVLGMLFGGPSASEKAAGLWSELPDGASTLGMSVDGSQVRIRLSSSVTRISTLARLQLVCTVAHLSTARAGVQSGALVTIRGTDGSIEPSACPV
ncbi:GerMN domain-containing protein [Streptomyces sp. NPDC060198]|uniref:GerMN domain-containing protein n=1 Tax=Streptomyces sp. NPDC060198 TaxID=3347070 RepID=UPI00365A74F3